MSSWTTLQLLAFIGSICVFLLPLLPHSAAQRTPDAAFHGWSAVDLAYSPTLPWVYLIDGRYRLVAVDNRTGEERASWSVPWSDPVVITSLEAIAVDAASNVYVTAFTTTTNTSLYAYRSLLLQFDARLTPLRNRSLTTLSPPSPATRLVVASNGYLFLFSANKGFTSLAPAPYVWCLEPQLLQQVDLWKAPIPFAPYNQPGATSYLLAIDSQDTLYFQEVSRGRRTFLISTGGDSVQSFDLFRNVTTQDAIVDLDVDANLVMHFIRSASTSVHRFDASGTPLSPLPAVELSGSVPTARVAFDSEGQLHVSDNVDGSLMSVSAAGAVINVVRPIQASLYYCGNRELLQTPHSGDLLLSSYSLPTMARRVGVQRGDLVRNYAFPRRMADEGCDVRGLDVGSQSGRLYSVSMCSTRIVLWVQEANGRLVSEALLPGTSYNYNSDRVRVDEQSGRVYVPYYSYNLWAVQVFDLQGRLQFNISTQQPPLGVIKDLVVQPRPDGGRLWLLDAWNQRVLVFHLNGSIDSVIVPQSVNLNNVNHLALDVSDARGEGGGVYLSQYIIQRQPSGLYTYNSSIARVDRAGVTTDAFMAPGGVTSGSLYGAMTVTDEGLYAFDSWQMTVNRWSHRRPTQPSATPLSTLRVHVANTVRDSPTPSAPVVSDQTA